MLQRLRRLLASVSGRRLAVALAGVLLLAQFAAAGHRHAPENDLDRRGTHIVCDFCLAGDRAGVAPPSIALRLPPPATALFVARAIGAAPTAPAPAGYSSRAPPSALS